MKKRKSFLVIMLSALMMFAMIPLMQDYTYAGVKGTITGLRQVAATEDSVSIAWNPVDDVAYQLIYGEDKDRVDSAYTHSYSAECGNITQYILNDTEKTLDGDENPYAEQSGDTVDESTDQILNNKRFRITFNLHDKWYTKAGQEEVKYLDDIVMNYLEQMVPSTVIVEVVYQSGEESPCDKLEITA